jgi:hypothetical protein
MPTVLRRRTSFSERSLGKSVASFQFVREPMPGVLH